MVLLLSALEEYKAEVDLSYKPPSSSSPLPAADVMVVDEIQKSRQVLSYLEDGEFLIRSSISLFINFLLLSALKEGIARIVRTFGDRLRAFRFPPPIAQKLQMFLIYAY